MGFYTGTIDALLQVIMILFCIVYLYGELICQILGVDLNRQWKTPVRALYPTIFTLKAFIQAQRKIREIGRYEFNYFDYFYDCLRRNVY